MGLYSNIFKNTPALFEAGERLGNNVHSDSLWVCAEVTAQLHHTKEMLSLHRVSSEASERFHSGVD